MKRRRFLKQAACFAGLPAIIPASALGKDGHVAPSNRITVAGIGLGPRGREVLAPFLAQKDVQFVADCDVQKERAEIIRRLVNRHYDNEDCVVYRRMEEVFAREDVDAVLIATGDRWHTPASILAARSGKDVYSEKPCAMTIDECRELDEEITKLGRVYQAGTQRRNVDNFRLAVELTHGGHLGKLHTVHAGSIKPTRGPEPLPGEPLPDPDLIDWDRWLGPAADRPYNQAYCRGRWRGHEGLSAGYNVLEWGAHTIDLCQWANQADGTVPVEYEPMGDDIHARYANGVVLKIRIAGFKKEGNWLGLGTCPVRFEGDQGWVEAGDHGLIKASREDLFGRPTPEAMYGTNPAKHVRNFLDCIKSREKPSCHSGVARKGHIAGHAAAIAWRLGRKVRLDPATERFIDDAEANALCKAERRKPYDI